MPFGSDLFLMTARVTNQAALATWKLRAIDAFRKAQVVLDIVLPFGHGAVRVNQQSIASASAEVNGSGETS